MIPDHRRRFLFHDPSDVGVRKAGPQRAGHRQRQNGIADRTHAADQNARRSVTGHHGDPSHEEQDFDVSLQTDPPTLPDRFR